MSSADKAALIDSIQGHLEKGRWKEAVAEMEKLFSLNPDPIIRVRMGDAYQKLNQKPAAVGEYLKAADLYARTGSVVKALAQYKLVLRLDPENKAAQERMSGLHSNTTIKEKAAEPVEEGKQKPAASVIPLFAGLSQVEFDEFARRMTVHHLSPGKVIVREGDRGKSVYIIATGSVRVYTTMLSGEQVELAKLWPGEFFGEISFLTGKPRTATIETLEDSVVLEVAEDKLAGLVQQHPHVQEVLQRYSEMRLKGTIETVIAKSIET